MATPPAATSRPAIMSPIASQSRKLAFAPAARSTAMPLEPSAFMTTIVQLPDSGSQTAVCSPAPAAEAAQNVCSVGGPAGSPPAVRR